jgi:hypothetical protein
LCACLGATIVPSAGVFVIVARLCNGYEQPGYGQEKHLRR